MKRLLVLFFILSSNMCYASGLGDAVSQGFNNSRQPNVSGTSQTGDGANQVINIGQNPQAQQQQNLPTPGSTGNGFEEADWNIDADLVPAMMIEQPGKRQIVPDALIIGTTYKFSDAIHMFAKYVQFEAPGAKMYDPKEVDAYKEAAAKREECGAPCENDEALESPEARDTNWQHQHLFYGFGLRWTINYEPENIQQIQVNLGYAVLTSVTETGTGNEVANLDAGLLAEFKYLWVRDNMAYGIVMSIVDLQPESEYYDDYMRGGYKYISFTVQFGLPGFN